MSGHYFQAQCARATVFVAGLRDPRGMKTPARLSWTVLPVADALDRLRQAHIDVPLASEWLGEWIALLHPADRPDAILVWREVGEPLIRDMLQADHGPTNAAHLGDVLRAAAGDWWRTAQAWTTFSRWDPNDSPDWSRWLAPCPAPDDDRLAAVLAPTGGWLLWDFQWMAALLGSGIDWETAHQLRLEWNLRRPGIEKRIANVRINGVLLEHVLMRRTLGPMHLTSRVDGWSVQRLAVWASEAVKSEATTHRVSDERIGCTLTAEEAKRVKEWAGPLSKAMQDEAVEFPGIEFVFGVGPFGEMLDARIGGLVLSLR